MCQTPNMHPNKQKFYMGERTRAESRPEKFARFPEMEVTSAQFP